MKSINEATLELAMKIEERVRLFRMHPEVFQAPRKRTLAIQRPDMLSVDRIHRNVVFRAGADGFQTPKKPTLVVERINPPSADRFCWNIVPLSVTANSVSIVPRIESRPRVRANVLGAECSRYSAVTPLASVIALKRIQPKPNFVGGNGEEVAPSVSIFRTAAILTPQSWRLQPTPPCQVNELVLVDGFALSIHRIEVAGFSASVHRIEFPPIREQVGRGGLFARSGGQSADAPKLAPVKRLDSPPEVKKADLAERLRWILTPQINQLVNDLSVPETPFVFQMQGIQWLKERDHGLLADEMGLGKTMQAILAARLLWRERRIENILIICPKSLIGNWQGEIAKWWPDASAHVREPKPSTDRQWFLRLATPNVLIKLINYEAVAREKEWLRENPIQHDLVIIDEAQRIKNGASGTAMAVKCLRGRRCWALTGTPLENRIEDLLSIMEFVHPAALKNIVASNAEVRAAVRPYILRRRLGDTEVQMQLPDRIDQDVEVELTEAQRFQYDRLEHDGVLELNTMGDTITVQHVFALIGKLIQTCNFDRASGESAKFERLLGDFEHIAESDRKALLFSRFVSEEVGIKRIARGLSEASYKVMELHGEIPARNRDDIITRFNASPIERALLISYEVGGVGLNLQAASYVFLFDRWWNPAKEDQAVKRAHRYGQKNPVIVRRFYCKNTIENRILEVLQKKRRLFREVIDDERPHESLGISQEELFGLFRDLKVRPPRSAATSGLRRIRFAQLSPHDFECIVADLYRAQGYNVDHTGGSGDGGIDVLAERKNNANVERIPIQCKHMTSVIGPEIVRSHWGVVNSDPSFTLGVLVASFEFSRDAQAFARGKRLQLVDGEQLKVLLRQNAVAEVVD